MQKPAKGPLRATIDRIVRDQHGKEQAVLVFDDGQQLVLPADRLPDGAKPQGVLAIDFRIDAEETSRRADQVRRLQQELFGK
jgi:hypothetical protein